MPHFLLDWFGSRELEQGFWLLTFMTAPVWLVLLLAPRSGFADWLGRPFGVASVYVLVWLYLAWQAIGLATMPAVDPADAYGTARGAVKHPLVFLLAWAHIQIGNLFVGCTIYREARRRHLAAPGELVLAWFFGPLALPAWLARTTYGDARRSRRGR